MVDKTLCYCGVLLAHNSSYEIKLLIDTMKAALWLSILIEVAVATRIITRPGKTSLPFDQIQMTVIAEAY